MGKNSEIEWTDHTFNPWRGCARVSPGCEHCYAEVFAKRVGFTGEPRPSGKPKLPLIWGAKAERVVASDDTWREPYKWNRAAEKAGKRARVFCASMADVFEDRPDLKDWQKNEVLREARARLWRVIHETPHLDWLLLTKRPENAERLAFQAWDDEFALSTREGEPPPSHWLPNIWLGTTCEDQMRANQRISELLKCAAKVRFVSYEPALEFVDFTPWLGRSVEACEACGTILSGSDPGFICCDREADINLVRGVDWIIVGGESGAGARPFELEWARAVVKHCHAAGVAVFVKQLGARPREVVPPDCKTIREINYRLKDPKGGDWDEWADKDLRVRQWPAP